jgi:hypothetical protein
MARHENEDVSSIQVPEANVERLYYLSNKDIVDDHGLSTYEKRGQKPIICAKRTENFDTGAIHYYVRFANSGLFNPGNIDPRYRIRPNWQLRNVSEKAFTLYIQFLETGYRTYLYNAEREI